mmetsp:Transcript_67951/g.210075  ORF Transcript_67951/g.210075 Transcript_67951/m.210075 type:complete len:402 (+) Transcript_67951:104-1309(+)
MPSGTRRTGRTAHTTPAVLGDGPPLRNGLAEEIHRSGSTERCCPGRSAACRAARCRPSGGDLLQDGLVEALHLVGGADGEGGALVHRRYLHVQHAVAGDAVGGLAARHLHEPSEGSRLEGQPQLGGRGLGGWIGEDALLLCELLADIRHETAGVAEGVAVRHVVVDELGVALDLLRGAHVRRRKDLAVLADLDLLAGADPLVPRAQGELVDAVVHGHEDRGPRPVERHEAHDLVAARGADEARGLVPDAHNGAHGPVVVHDGAAVQGVPTEDVLPVRVCLHDFRLLLRGGLADELGGLGKIPEQVVRDDVHGQLAVAEGVGGVIHSDQVHPQGLCDFHAGIQQLLDHALHLRVLEALGHHLVDGVVLVLGHGVSVEGRVRGAVRVVALRPPRHHRPDGRAT